jgi:chromosome segregation ATPase
MSEGRCEAHDNWHAHCQRCCSDEIVELRARLAAAEEQVTHWKTAYGSAQAISEGRLTEIQTLNEHLGRVTKERDRARDQVEVTHAALRKARAAKEAANTETVTIIAACRDVGLVIKPTDDGERWSVTNRRAVEAEERLRHVAAAAWNLGHLNASQSDEAYPAKVQREIDLAALMEAK